MQDNQTQQREVKRLAICFNGHLRTYEHTYKSFFKNIVAPNLEDNWQIDIFIHTWDRFEKSGFAWHNNQFPNLDNKLLSNDDKEKLTQIYQPKTLLIETLEQERGTNISISKSLNLALTYSNKNSFEYDYTMLIRPDLYFLTPLKINAFIDFYKTPTMSWCTLPKRYIFCVHNNFMRMPVADPRYVAESDLLYFASFNPAKDSPELPRIAINYMLFRDFFMLREVQICKIFGKASLLFTHLKLRFLSLKSSMPRRFFAGRYKKYLS